MFGELLDLMVILALYEKTLSKMRENMIGIFKRSSAVLLTLILTLFVVASSAGAQTTTGSGNGFRVSPVRQEFVIEKGSSQQFTMNIENPTDATVTAQLLVNDFVSSENETGEPRLILDESGDPPKNSFKTLVAPLADITLGPREDKDVQIDVKVPADANSGGYYGAIRVVPASTTGSGTVGLTASVGTIVLVKVPGDLTEKLDLIELTASQNGKAKSFFTGGDVSVMSRIKNSGDIHLQPFGKVQVKNMFGKVVHEYEFNNIEPRSNVLPDSIRKFEDSVPKPGGGWLGRYTVELNLGISQGSGDLISTSTSFWYMPWWSLAVLLAVIVALVAGGYALYRRYGNPKPKHGAKK
jgi:hypothetical protein